MTGLSQAIHGQQPFGIGKRFSSTILLPHTPIKELFDGGMASLNDNTSLVDNPCAKFVPMND